MYNAEHLLWSRVNILAQETTTEHGGGSWAHSYIIEAPPTLPLPLFNNSPIFLLLNTFPPLSLHWNSSPTSKPYSVVKDVKPVLEERASVLSFSVLAFKLQWQCCFGFASPTPPPFLGFHFRPRVTSKYFSMYIQEYSVVSLWHMPIAPKDPLSSQYVQFPDRLSVAFPRLPSPERSTSPVSKGSRHQIAEFKGCQWCKCFVLNTCCPWGRLRMPVLLVLDGKPGYRASKGIISHVSFLPCCWRSRCSLWERALGSLLSFRPYSMCLFSWPHLLYDQIAMAVSNWGIVGVLESHGVWGRAWAPWPGLSGSFQTVLSDPGTSEVCTCHYVTFLSLKCHFS